MSLSSRIHLACVAREPEVVNRAEQIAKEFEYGFESSADVDSYASQMKEYQVVMIILSTISFENTKEIAGHVQVLRQISQEAFILVVAQKKISADDVQFIKKSGASLILLEDSYFLTSQLEYICSQMIRGSLIPVKSSEIKANTEIDFNILVMMPLNRKILPAAFKGTTLTENKIKKMQDAQELYIRRDDLPKFRKYVEKNTEMTAAGLDMRCRLKYLELCRAHADLIFLLVDQSEAASFAKGKQLLEDCIALASELMTAVATVEDPWSVVSNSAIGESASAERSSAYGAMAGVLALSIDKASSSDTLLAGLLADVGLLDLSPTTLKKIRATGIADLTAEELLAYQQHPLASVSRCLGRKLPLPDKVKAIMQATHEHANGRGFPKKIGEAKIPLETMIIQFCQIVDSGLIVKMGSKRPSVKDVQKTVIEAELAKKEMFGIEFLNKVRTALGI